MQIIVGVIVIYNEIQATAAHQQTRDLSTARRDATMTEIKVSISILSW